LKPKKKWRRVMIIYKNGFFEPEALGKTDVVKTLDTSKTVAYGKWDCRFMELAKTVSAWSKDPKHKVGAVITDSAHIVQSLGYNGPPKGTDDNNMQGDRKKHRTLHAEMNAVLNTGQNLYRSTIYVYPYFPCAQCAAILIQKGVKRVVFCEGHSLSFWAESQTEAAELFAEAGIVTSAYTLE
jgi:dCMP deaminase